MSAFRSIRSRLIVWFLAIALAPLVVVLYASRQLSESTIERGAIASMAAIAEAKAAQLDAFARERVRNVSSIATGLAFVGAAQELGASFSADGTRDEAAYAAALAKFKARIDDFAKVCEFPQFLIIDLKGRVVYATSESPLLHRSLGEPVYASSGLARAVEAVRRDRTTRLTPATLTSEGIRPSIEVVGPLVRGEELVGFAAVTLDPADIDAIVTDYTGLGKTGDIVGLATVGPQVIATTPSRANPNLAYTPIVKRGDERLRRYQEIVSGSPFRGRATDIEGHDAMGAWVRIPSLGWGLAVTQHADEVFAVARAQQSVVTTVALVAILPVALLGFFVARSLSRPVSVAAATAKRVAAGDLTVPVAVVGSGEPRNLLESMHAACGNLVDLLQRLREASIALASTAQIIRSSSAEQSDLARRFGTAGTDVAATVRELTANQQELNRSVQKVAGDARDASTAAAEGRMALLSLAQAIDALAQGAQNISAHLSAIQERAERIDTVVASVAKVANQTNLLSVNAAMEAERAGEAGAGFRAVAREIHRLSTQTADATLAIEAIVAEMRAAVSTGVTDMAHYGSTVRQGVSTVTTIGTQLGHVIGGVERLSAEVELVARGMQAQALGVSQVGDSIRSLSDGASRTAASVEKFNSASAELESQARGIARDVESFRLPAQ
jgi:methyl-accepting chemotaxis protein WspA